MKHFTLKYFLKFTKCYDTIRDRHWKMHNVISSTRLKQVSSRRTKLKIKTELASLPTGNVNPFLLETDDVCSGLNRRKLDIEQIFRLVANFAQFRHSARGRYRRFHVQRARTCPRKKWRHTLQINYCLSTLYLLYSYSISTPTGSITYGKSTMH